MEYISNILFLILSIAGFWLFYRNFSKINRNIKLGKEINRSDQPGKRWAMMGMVALGQTKMIKRPVAGVLHIILYLSFLIINMELIEIFVDGLTGSHRFLAAILGAGTYAAITSFLEILALLVLIAVVFLWARRNWIHLKRLNMKELAGWPKKDANFILIIESFLMIAYLVMNGTDFALQNLGYGHYFKWGSFPVSSRLVTPWVANMEPTTLVIFERVAWWLHIIGVFFFMNYLYYSKHLHIILAFLNTWFAKLKNPGEFPNLASVTNEVKMMMDPNADPYAAAPTPPENASPEKFGASDIFDLHRVQLMNAYSCTECGRCTSVCPANITGKKLSPRKIMMDTRDRLEEVGKNIDINGKFIDDGKKLIDDHISREELRACTTCNACTEACPILIDPLSIIMSLRQFMIMEESSAPQEWNLMMQNIENNGAPWQYNQGDRLNWVS